MATQLLTALGVFLLWIFLIIWADKISKPADIFIKLMSVPMAIFLGTYWMTLGSGYIFKGPGIIIIIIGAWTMLNEGFNFMRNKRG
jgi:hypothetical protein